MDILGQAALLRIRRRIGINPAEDTSLRRVSRTEHHVSAQFGAALAEALPRLRRYAIALAGDVSTADDLMQDCMERAWKNRNAMKDERAIFAWLRTILHNANIDRVRLRRRRPDEAESLDAVSDTLSNGAAGDGPALSMDVVRAVNRLTIEHRQVLLMIGLEGLSYREIADELGVPIGTVMSRLARARERLRALLEEGV
jgi:RNA polymerase sigma-70 factor (ECF subfamily)